VFDFLPVSFLQPLWLVLLAVLLPVVWLVGWRALAELGPWRRWISLGLRSAVVVLLVAALAGALEVQRSRRLTVLYLLDQSLSIPPEQRQAMRRYVIQDVRRNRNAARGDYAGVIVFARDARAEVAPYDDDLAWSGQLENVTDLRQDGTDLAGALEIAAATFPEDAAKRVVIVTDGNPTTAGAKRAAAALADQGISIYTVPVRIDRRSEVEVEKVWLPASIREGQPFRWSVVLNYRPLPDRAITGRLMLVRRAGNYEEPLLTDDDGKPVSLPVSLEPDPQRPNARLLTKVVSFQHRIERPDFYTYEARFIPDNPAHDAIARNNRATAFAHVRGKGRVLLIVEAGRSAEFERLANRLREIDKLEVDIQTTDQLFAGLADLQRYDAVVLADAPRSSGDVLDRDIDRIHSFSDDQISALVANTHEMGAGLVMIGGPKSFGAGGWANTELEKAMPVDFQVRNTKVRANTALAMVMHACEIPQGNFWQKQVAREALKGLGPMDYCGIIHLDWNRGIDWVWASPKDSKPGIGLLPVGPNRRQMLRILDKMSPGDMQDFETSMAMGYTGLMKTPNASIRHMIVISDGDPTPPLPSTMAKYQQAGIQVTTVAIGSHGLLGSTTMRDIAKTTGGRYYVVRQADAAKLPKIYQNEIRRIAKPLIYEPPGGVRATIEHPDNPHEILKGISAEALPTIGGFVLTTLKDGPLIEVALTSPKPADRENATLLATRRFGLGKTAALTTDAGTRWVRRQPGDQYDKLLSQLIRWSLRPTIDTGKFTVATRVENGRVRVTVDALEEGDSFLKFLNMVGAAIGPDNKSQPLKFEERMPGRYVAEFTADQAGSYFLSIQPGAGRAPLRAGVNVPYGDEFRAGETNTSLLTSLASLKPRGGEPGRMIRGDFDDGEFDDLLKVNTFVHDLALAQSTQDLWPDLLLLAACVFFADVLVRRVAIDFSWLAAGLAWVGQRLGRDGEQGPREERVERLRSLKAEISADVERRRASARFEPDPEAPEPGDVAPDVAGAGPRREPPRQKKETKLTPEKEEESYTERLLKAKRKARRKE